MAGPGPGDTPPLREVIARHGLSARRSLGQHFLLDPNLTRRIARAAGPLGGIQVIEVGPGPGGLTRALLSEGAAHVHAIERDARCIGALRELEATAGGRLTIVEGDAREVDVAALAPPPRRIVANLPYNLSTVLLRRWLGQADAFECLTLMFQKEVADRLVAAPGSKTYGRLSILAQWLCEVRILFEIPAAAFTPPPKVTSALVGLRPRAEPLAPAEIGALERVTGAAFGQRRKMLRSSLRALGGDAGALLAAAGIDPTARAETLTVTQLCALAREYSAREMRKC